MNYGPGVYQSFYDYLPYALKNVLASLYGFEQRSDRYGSHFARHYSILYQTQNYENLRIIVDRNRLTIEFVNHAIRSNRYYSGNSLYKQLNSIKDITNLPILKKTEVRLAQDILINIIENRLKEKTRMVHTSGTTGKSLHFPITLSAFQREYAFRALHYDWGGVAAHKRLPVAVIAGHPVAGKTRVKPPFWTYDFANNWLILSSYHLSDSNLKYYIQEIEKYKPHLIQGYPSSLYLLALGYQKYGQNKIRPKAIYSFSETLFEHQRKVIERAFSAKVFNWYGNTELCANIVECEYGELHLKHEHSFVEILDDNNKEVTPGQRGRLICTGFGNTAFPLIRYDVGDIVTVSENQSPVCGRGGLLIDSIEGRAEDYIVGAHGQLIGRLDHLFKDTQNIIEAQILQKKVGAVVLNIVKNSKYGNEDETLLLKEASYRFGLDMQIDIDYVHEIQRGKSGKLRFIVSELDIDKEMQKLNNHLF